ncbi:unnamed protein product [Rotaria magnacalcarata]|uniref:Receptor for retinol uptake STRA6 n=1 Tax=Rotaria magnacalcarata TaxID=392030 RepID=A0A816GKN5_9BILA|nr:unnamed protein product [Rotaria magnacalcarata]
MQTIVFSLFLLVTIDIIVQSSTCTSPVNLQNVDIVDITASWERFPTIIRKIKDVVDRFRCPKGWQRLGGSCYFISSIASASNEANSTCNLLYFNHSRLMQIRHPIELFYAADILIKNNFSSLMLNIHPQLLKRKHIDELLMNGQGEWQQMKENFREAQMKDYKSKTQILDELHAAGLSISRHSKKIKHIIHEKNRKAQIDHSALYEYDADEPIDGVQKRTKIPMQNPMKINKQKYYEDDIDSIDAADNFAQIKDVRSVCDQVIWNDIKNDSQVYILRTVLHADKIICSLSASKQDIEYNHVCEYVSSQGQQIIISLIIIVVLYALSSRPSRWCFLFCVKQCIRPEDEENVTIDHEHRKHFMGDHANLESRHFTKAQEAAEYILPKTPQRFLNPKKNDLVRLCLVGGLNVFILSLLLILTAILHFMTFQNEIFHENKFNILLQDTIRIVTQRDRILNYRVENLIFAPIALVLIVIFSWSTKRERRCPTACNGRPSIIPPIQPFHTVNRFTTAAVFSLLTFEILKLFEELFGSIALSRDGVISFFLEYSAVFFLLGLRYYPILVSLQLSNVVNRFFAFLYIAAHVAYTIMRDGSCMHFLSRSQTYSVSEASKLHLELGNWFIIFGLLKNIPYFVLLSYIGAELTVRFAYDSIYVPYKKKRSIWLSSETRCEEFKFSRYYVKELFRRNNRRFSTVTTANKEIIHPTNRSDHKNEVKLLRQGEQSWMRKFLDRIYYLDNSFRFTTMAICTYSATWVALYYLACTCIFWHISLTTEHVSYLKFYIESIFKTDGKSSPFDREIIFSATVAFTISALQLCISINNYKRHKQQLYKGIYAEVPMLKNVKANSIMLKSFHYFGFFIAYMAFDCFLGVASCIIRLINATLFNLLFIGRLDYSLLGRPLEKFDSGFTTYVSYLHVEVAHTHPVMLAFCNLLYDDIIQRRPKHLCNHECSIGSSELDSDDNKSERVRPSKRESFTPNRISRRESNRHASRKNRSDDSDDENIERKNDIRLIGRKIKLSTTPLAHPSKNKKGFKPVKYNLDNDDVSGEEGSSIKIKSRTKGKNQSEIDFIKKMTATSLAVNANDSEDNEEIEVKQRKQQSQKMKNKNSPIQPTMFEVYSTVSHLIDRNMMNKSIKSSQKKQARFRWHLAYTLLNNYQLLGQRKGYPRRLRQTYAQRSNCLRGVDEYSAEPRPCIEERIFREDSSAKSISSDQHSAFVSSRRRRRSISVIEHSPRSSVKCYIDIQSSNYYNAAANKQKVNQQSLACPALSPNCSVAQAALNTNDDVQHIQSCSKKLARKLHKKGLHYHANESPPSESTVFTFSADTTIIAQKLTMTSKQQQQQTQCRTVVSDQRTSKSSFQLPYPSEQISSVPSIIDSNHQIQTVNENSKKKQATKTKFSAQNQKKPVECESK